MADPYAWIDPFDEMERLERQARYAREDGRREVLTAIAREGEELFRVKLKYATEEMAHRWASDVAKPYLAANFADHEHRKQVERTRFNAAIDVMRPLVAHVTAKGEMEMTAHDFPTRSITVEYRTVEPFRIGYAIAV